MRLSLILLTTITLLAATYTYTSWSEAQPILAAQPKNLPAALTPPSPAKWTTWTQREDKAIRARLQQGDLDSMVNFLLFGTSFTTQPRIKVAAIGEASKSGLLRTRVDDLVTALHTPGNSERLNFLRALLSAQNIDPDASAETGVFVYKNLQRVLEERRVIAQRAETAKQTTASALDRASLFEDRGVSLDTSILPDFALEQTLRELQKRGVLHEGQIARIAIVGPGLDFADKNEDSAYDYYPQQTIQPFAVYDSLLRLGLAKPRALQVSVFDISTRVIDHLERARKKNEPYIIQLPHDVSRPWPAELTAYWRTLGDRIATPVAPIQPPQIFAGLETRAIQVRPEVVLACQPINLNIVLQRLTLPAADRYDLIIGTNIFIYYGPFEQSLALENAGAMLKPGGLLLTNDRLPEVPGGAMQQAGTFNAGTDTVGWYRKTKN
jgi:SAM-dependent methyltransferase